MTAYDELSDPHLIRPDDALAVLAGAPWQRLVVTGDSLAEGIGDPSPGYRPLSWADRLREALSAVNPDLAYLNLGVRDLKAREVRDVQLAGALAFRPDLAVVVAGGNDLLAAEWDPPAVEADLDAMIGDLRRAGADVVTFVLMDIVAAYPWMSGTPLEERLLDLHTRVRALSHAHGALLVDVGAHPACAEPERYSQDLKHGTHAGHALVASEVIRRLGVACSA